MRRMKIVQEVEYNVRHSSKTCGDVLGFFSMLGLAFFLNGDGPASKVLLFADQLQI